VRGDVHAVYDQDHGSLHWNAARVGAYGGIPSYRPLPLGHGAELVPASALGGIWMDATRYYWRGARYYDSESFQWLSFDPYGYAAGDNPYGYWPDPMNFTDPDGRLAVGTVHSFNATSGSFADQMVNGLTTTWQIANYMAASVLDFLGGPGSGAHLRRQADAIRPWQSPFQQTGYYRPGELGDQVGQKAAVAAGAYGVARQAPGLLSRIGNWWNSWRNPTTLPPSPTTPPPLPAAKEIPPVIYRGGKPSPSNLKLRPGEDALSFRDSISNPLPKTERPVFRPGDDYIGIDTSKLPRGSVVPDNVPPGHVSVQGVTPEQLQQAVIERGKFPK